MGILDHASDIFSFRGSRKRKKPMQTVEIKVKMDCEGCVRKVKNAMYSMKGVKSVDVNKNESKVSVYGRVEANKVLKRVRETGKKAEIWPYVPYNLVSYPYAPQSYDKKAPSGYVRDVPQAFPSPNALEERLTFLFSDENPNACSIM